MLADPFLTLLVFLYQSFLFLREGNAKILKMECYTTPSRLWRAAIFSLQGIVNYKGEF